MKLISLLIVLLIFVGCVPADYSQSSQSDQPEQPTPIAVNNKEFQQYDILGTFKGNTLYKIHTPNNMPDLYLSIRDADSSVQSVQYQKTGQSINDNVPLIQINGEEMTKEEALELLVGKQ